MYIKYNKEIRFAYINYSGDIISSAIALECAKKQNRFWEMYNQLLEFKTQPSSKNIFSIADKMEIDKIKFIKDFQDSTICHTIIKDINQLNDKGFWGVPSIVVNNHIISDVYSQNAIENELSKNN